MIAFAYNIFSYFVQSELFSYFYPVILAAAIIGAIIGVIKYVSAYK